MPSWTEEDIQAIAYHAAHLERTGWRLEDDGKWIHPEIHGGMSVSRETAIFIQRQREHTAVRKTSTMVKLPAVAPPLPSEAPICEPPKPAEESPTVRKDPRREE